MSLLTLSCAGTVFGFAKGELEGKVRRLRAGLSPSQARRLKDQVDHSAHAETKPAGRAGQVRDPARPCRRRQGGVALQQHDSVQGFMSSKPTDARAGVA